MVFTLSCIVVLPLQHLLLESRCLQGKPFVFGGIPGDFLCVSYKCRIFAEEFIPSVVLCVAYIMCAGCR